MTENERSIIYSAAILALYEGEGAGFTPQLIPTGAGTRARACAAPLSSKRCRPLLR